MSISEYEDDMLRRWCVDVPYGSNLVYKKKIRAGPVPFLKVIFWQGKNGESCNATEVNSSHGELHQEANQRGFISFLALYTHVGSTFQQIIPKGLITAPYLFPISESWRSEQLSLLKELSRATSTSLNV